MPAKDMEQIVNLTKRRGFVFPSAEIYGGFRSTYDYGPLGALMLRNVRDAWWRAMTQRRDDVVPIEDFSNETLLALAERLEQSATFQQLILREVELDEIYRRVDTAMSAETEAGALERLAGMVFEAHDLAADGHPLEAARLLRQAMTGGPAC